MNPTLLLCVITIPVCIATSGWLFVENAVAPASIILAFGCSPIAIALWQIVRFTKTDPDRLQREEHNENMLQIRHGLSVKQGNMIIEMPISNQLTENPKIEDRHGE
jgi:hypothetical protein